MWPFNRPQNAPLEAIMDEAIGLAAERWMIFNETSDIPENVNLRDRLPHFSRDLKPLLANRFPSLRRAPDEVILLIIAEGIAATGAMSRRRIELQLGIVLPQR